MARSILAIGRWWATPWTRTNARRSRHSRERTRSGSGATAYSEARRHDGLCAVCFVDRLFLYHTGENVKSVTTSSQMDWFLCYSPMTYSHPSLPIHTSWTLPAGTSILAPTPKVCLVGLASRGYVMVRDPRRTRCVVSPECECGG